MKELNVNLPPGHLHKQAPGNLNWVNSRPGHLYKQAPGNSSKVILSHIPANHINHVRYSFHSISTVIVREEEHLNILAFPITHSPTNFYNTGTTFQYKIFKFYFFNYGKNWVPFYILINIVTVRRFLHILPTYSN